MSARRLIFLFYLFIAPLIVALSQVSLLEFPTVDLFTGAPYTPFPQVFYAPGLIGFVLFAFGGSLTFLLRYINRKFILSRYKRTIWISSTVVFLIVFWFGINLSQRAIILDYLSAINANGLHFLRIFWLPTRPEIFPKDGYAPFYTAIITGSLGIIGIFIYFYTLFKVESRNQANESFLQKAS